MKQIPIPEPDRVVDAIRTGLVKLLPAEDLEHVDLDMLGIQTPLLGLPVDSAVLMALMTELEDTFTVFIDEEAAFAFQTIGDVADYIRQRLTEKARRLAGS
ncbi:MAG TPA: phosphopantetheine-binding protein [Mycobacterium sp.]|uniref:acyl carrier protein n=1 Tax=Mycolicibacterium sp. TaxID=2320850 RepID=UPI0025F973F8|nr:phosphopantetheine-binding protein [Mycolicibacterium sp.]HPX36286.1 phosphopantetheine-binding protein [Mycobacterium sp.]HQC75149.1 phosphopantetheine-binding protein [Mycobacterium sp.]